MLKKLVLFRHLSSLQQSEAGILKNLMNLFYITNKYFFKNLQLNHSLDTFIPMNCDHRGKRFVFQTTNKQVCSSERSTQQATCYTKHAVTSRIPVTARRITVNEASKVEFVEVA